MNEKDKSVDAEERVRRVMARDEARVRESILKEPGTLHDIEMDVDRLGAMINEEVTKEIVDNLGDGYQGARLSCRQCSCRAKCGGRRSRQVITLHGRLQYKRAYYHCRRRRQGFCPVDDQLGLGKDDCSRTVRPYAARLASYLPFAIAADELRPLRRIDLSPTTVQRQAKAVGERIGREWDSLTQQVKTGQAPPSKTYVKRLYGNGRSKVICWRRMVGRQIGRCLPSSHF